MIARADKAATESTGSGSSKLTQRAYLNAVSSLLDYASRIAVTLVVTPILVNGLGSTLFGVWQILKRLVSYMSGLDGRPTQALKWVIANYQGTEDSSVKREAVGSALGVWLLSIPVLGVIGLILVWLSPMFTNVPEHLSMLVRIACSLLVFNLMLSGLVSLPAEVLRGMNLGYKRMGVVAGMNVLGGGLTVAAIYLDWGLVGVVTAYVVQAILTGILFWHLTRVFVPWFGVTIAPFAKVRQFLNLSIWYAAWNIVNNLLVSSDVVILGMLVSASSVTSYVLTGYVSQMLVAVITMTVGSAAPGLGKLVGLGQYEKIFGLRREMLWLSLFFSTLTGSMILLWNRSFVTLWAGNEHYAGMWPNFLLVLIAVQLLLLRNETYLIDLTLDVRQKVFLGFAAALLSVGLALLMVPRLGIVGLCLSLLSGRFLLSISYPKLISTFLKTTTVVVYQPMGRPLIVMIILFLVSSYVGSRILAHSWLELFAYFMISLPPIFAVCLWVSFSREQRQILVNRIRNIGILKLSDSSLR